MTHFDAVTTPPALAHPDPLLAAVLAAQAREQLFPLAGPGRLAAPTVVVVAVSGGADSVCLLHVLHTLTSAWRLTLHVAHVDHGLRPEAPNDAAFAAALASGLGLPFHATALDPRALRGQACGLEAAARAARYAWLGELARQVTPPGRDPIVAVGHQADDQAETVLLHLLQGAGVRGLAGMRWVSLLPGAAATGEPPIQLVRPLLGVARAEVEAYLARHRLPWRTDATNQQPEFLRNRLRHEVLPLLAAINPQVTAGLGRTATLMADAAARLDALDRQELAALCLEPPTTERVVLDWAAWARQSLSARRALLHAALAQLAVDHRSLGFAQVDELARRAGLGPPASGPHPLAGGAAWTRAGAAGDQPARLSLHRASALPFTPRHPYLDAVWRAEQGAVPLSVPGASRVGAWQLTLRRLRRDDLRDAWQTNPDPWRAYLDASAAGNLALTVPSPGQAAEPLGMAGKQKKLGDLFTDHKIPRGLRAGWPLIVDPATQRVLWVCGIQIAHAARITPETTQILALTWEPAAA